MLIVFLFSTYEFFFNRSIGAEPKDVGRKISRGGGATKKKGRKIPKKTEKNSTIKPLPGGQRKKKIEK